MRFRNCAMFVATALAALPGSKIMAEEITFESLLGQMVDRDVLTRMPATPYRARMSSSYDRKSVANNPEDGLYVEKNGRDWGKGWFANHDFQQYVRIEEREGRKEYVLHESEGPGAIVRWWSIAFNKGTARIYLDGRDKPVVEMDVAELVGEDGLVGKPFSFLASDDSTNPDWRGRNLYLPIPYAAGCKITLDQQPEYYQINHISYGPGTKVETFSIDLLEEHERLVESVGKMLLGGNKNPGGGMHRVRPSTLKPGDQVSLELTSPAAVRQLAVKISAIDYQQALRSTVISMNCDGKDTLWMPIGTLGGVGYSKEGNDTYFVDVDPAEGLIRCHYVMPFERRATVTLVNHGRQDVSIEKFQAATQPYEWNDSSLYFHGTWFELRNISTQNRSDLNYVTVKGRGRYVGTSITIFNTCDLPSNQTWWGEGDDKVYVDGEEYPSVFGTGTEDYFGYAFCRPQRYSTPFISQPCGEGNKKWGYSNNNRYHILDDIPFNKSIQFDMEIWHPFRKNMNYAVATFYYADKNSSANIEPDPGAVKHKVAIHRDDVLGVTVIPGTLEFEGVVPVDATPGLGYSDQLPAPSFQPDKVLSGSRHLFVGSKRKDDFVEFMVPVADDGAHDLTLCLSKSYDFGKVSIAVNGERVAENVDLYSPELAVHEVGLGAHEPRDGGFRIRIAVTGRNPENRNEGMLFGIDRIVGEKADGSPAVFERR